MKRVLFFLCSVFLISCGSDEAKITDYTAQNEQEIVDYLAANELTAMRSDTGLYYIIEEQGTGDMPVASSNVTVAYKGYFTDGTVFDQSDASGISFPLTGVIKGWTEGITYFNEGGSGVLLVPSHLGYGRSNVSSIPGGSVLIFDVHLITIN